MCRRDRSTPGEGQGCRELPLSASCSETHIWSNEHQGHSIQGSHLTGDMSSHFRGLTYSGDAVDAIGSGYSRRVDATDGLPILSVLTGPSNTTTND